MNLNDLPEDILIVIIKLLDVKSCYNLYNTSTRLRYLIRVGHAVKVCKFSMNTMATALSLKLNFFKDISTNVQHLNFSGVSDLNKTSLMIALKKVKKLQTLDVSFTKIVINDLLGVEKICPNLKNVTMDFVLFSSNIVITHDHVLQLQNLFKNFENVHFIGNTHTLILSELPVAILTYAKLDSLKFTVVFKCYEHFDNYYPMCYKVDQVLHFKTFNIYFLNLRENPTVSNMLLSTQDILSKYEEKCEFIIISAFRLHLEFCVSSLFIDFFKKHFNITAKCMEKKYTIPIQVRNIAIMIWDREGTEFNDSFYDKLKQRLLPYIPYNYLPNSDSSVPINNDWFFTTPVLACEQTNEEPEEKKRRISKQCIDLDYDELFAIKEKIKFSLIFDCKINVYVSLPTNYNYLKKLTYLCLFMLPRVEINFFKILFQNCDNLITLNVKSVNSCSRNLARYLDLSNSLKNLRLSEKGTDFNLMVAHLSKCKTLENIMLLDHNECYNFPDFLTVFQNCTNLYNLFLQAKMYYCVRQKTINMLSKSKSTAKRHCLNIQVCNHLCHCSYNPYFDVFDIEPIKHNM